MWSQTRLDPLTVWNRIDPSLTIKAAIHSRRYATHIGLMQNYLQTVSVSTNGDHVADLQLVVSDIDTGGGGRPSVPLHGIVTDSAKSPIDGARITYPGGREPVFSNSSGRFGICSIPGKQVRLRIEHEQYRARTIGVRLDVRSFDRELEIELRKTLVSQPRRSGGPISIR